MVKNKSDELHIISKIQNELLNQYNKFGIQHQSLEFWNTILIEEIGDVSKEIIRFNSANSFNEYANNKEKALSLIDCRTEIIQSISVLIQMYYQTIKISEKIP